jgi:hypothetical protein
MRMRFAAGAVRDLGAYTLRTGRWWIPLLFVALVAAIAVASATQTAVPVAVYTLF